MLDGLDQACAALRRELPGLAGVYLFGSCALGRERAGSDVDLAVFAGRAIAHTRFAQAREQAARALGRDVDLVDLAAADPILQMQVLTDGRLIDVADGAAIGRYELRILRDYRDLKRRRAGIEADIVERGRVHAR